MTAMAFDSMRPFGLSEGGHGYQSRAGALLPKNLFAHGNEVLPVPDCP